MSVHPSPIGVFDSGLGGLSVLREIRRLLPEEELIYAADSRWCPYGGRSLDEITTRSLAMAGALRDRGAKLLVVACNTASAVALEELRSRLALPIVGLEPAVKPAVRLSQRGRIGVLATPRTAGSKRLARLIATHAAGCDVRVVPAPGLVELVELGSLDGPAVESRLRELVGPLLVAGVDAIVLGCTHYQFLRPALARVAGPDVTIVDSGAAVARRTERLLREADALAPAGNGALRCLTTGDAGRFSDVAGRLLGEEIRVEALAI